MCPMHETAQVIPFVHAANLHTITHSKRHAFRKVDIVCDQQRYAVADIDDEALVARTVIVVRQQSRHEALNLDPVSGIAFVERSLQVRSLWLIIVRPAFDGYRVPQKTRLAIPGCRAFFVCRVLAGCYGHHRDLNTAIDLPANGRAVIRNRTQLTHSDDDHAP